MTLIKTGNKNSVDVSVSIDVKLYEYIVDVQNTEKIYFSQALEKIIRRDMDAQQIVSKKKH